VKIAKSIPLRIHAGEVVKTLKPTLSQSLKEEKYKDKEKVERLESIDDGVSSVSLPRFSLQGFDTAWGSCNLL